MAFSMKLSASAIAVLLVGAPAFAQTARPSGAVRQACAADVQRLCGNLGRDRQAIRQCIASRRAELSSACLDAIKASGKGGAQPHRAGADPSSPAAAQGKISLRYQPASTGKGSNLFSLDLYPAKTDQVPLVIFVHGGVWQGNGDKKAGEAGQPQAFLPNGYAYASINFRQYPQAGPEESAADVAKAVAFLSAKAEQYGYDGRRIVLMGHSSGAYLAAIVAVDPQYLRVAGVKPAAVRALVLLDGAGYNLPRQIASGDSAEIYRTVFGSDRAKQRALSPLTHVGEGPVPDAIFHHVASRDSSQVQADELAAALRKSGAKAKVFAAEGETHRSINQGFGEDGDAVTDQTFAFLKQVLR